jgi:hypothetical protein
VEFIPALGTLGGIKKSYTQRVCEEVASTLLRCYSCYVGFRLSSRMKYPTAKKRHNELGDSPKPNGSRSADSFVISLSIFQVAASTVTRFIAAFQCWFSAPHRPAHDVDTTVLVILRTASTAFAFLLGVGKLPDSSGVAFAARKLGIPLGAGVSLNKFALRVVSLCPPD